MSEHQRPLPKTLEDAEAELSNRVYEASRIVEELEHAGLCFGNGHHVRQNIAQFAVEQLRHHWKGPKGKDV